MILQGLIGINTEGFRLLTSRGGAVTQVAGFGYSGLNEFIRVSYRHWTWESTRVFSKNATATEPAQMGGFEVRARTVKSNILDSERNCAKRVSPDSLSGCSSQCNSVPVDRVLVRAITQWLLFLFTHILPSQAASHLLSLQPILCSFAP